MIAYPNNDKAMYMERVRLHREHDELIRGVGWEMYDDGRPRGCAVGCTLHEYNHGKYEPLLGVPRVLAELEDWLFENLPENHLAWPERFLGAIQPGADLSNVWPLWCVRMLTRRLGDIGEGQEPWRVKCREVVESTITACHDGSLASAAKAAEAAETAKAAKAAAKEAAAWTAWAAWAAEAAEAVWAAKAAKAAWAAWAAWAGEVRIMADDLIELLRTAPIP